MSIRAEQHRAEIEEYRRVQEYYATTRQLWIESITFAFALIVSMVAALRRLGIVIMNHEYAGQWMVLGYWTAFFLFVALDSLLAKQRHPVPVLFGPLNPERIFEKFAAQGRIWQLVLVLMLPVTARFITAVRIFLAAH